MSSQPKTSFTVGKAAQMVGLPKAILYSAIKEGSLKAWRPWSKGDLRINLEELDRWAGRATTSSAA